MTDTLDLLVRTDGAELELLAPTPGVFTLALPAGALLAAGAPAGVLIVLGREHRLRVPAGVQGRIVSERPERVHEPVGHRAPLYRLAPLAAEGTAQATDKPRDAAAGTEGPTLTSPQSGRFYRRPSPTEAPYAPEGSELEEGDPVGLIEVMKTFAHVPYRAQAGLPQRARVVRWLVEDGAEIRRGDPLVLVEPLQGPPE